MHFGGFLEEGMSLVSFVYDRIQTTCVLHLFKRFCLVPWVPTNWWWVNIPGWILLRGQLHHHHKLPFQQLNGAFYQILNRQIYCLDLQR